MKPSLLISLTLFAALCTTVISIEDEYLLAADREGLELPYVTYGNGATSRRTLPLCASSRSMCNIVYKRFWLPLQVTRMCKCPRDCPWKWEDSNDNQTLQISSRVQLKFCSPVGALPTCSKSDNAVITETSYTDPNDLRTHVEVNCSCPRWSRFRRKQFIIADKEGMAIRKHYYSCEPLPECNSGDLCGYVTAENYQTYFKCTCPSDPEHLCIFKDRKKKHILELLYDGLAYSAYCTPSEY